MVFRLVPVRKSRLFIALLIFIVFTVSVIISFSQKSDLYHRAISPGTPQDAIQNVAIAINKQLLGPTAKEVALTINKESFSPAATVSISTAEKNLLIHQTYLISRTRCTQTFFILILVVSAPDNIGRRNSIRKTWASDPSMNLRWKTMFLIGQAKDSTQEEYLKAENFMYNDLLRGSHRDTYQNLTLKTVMGLEWAAKYCDFQFLFKTDDDVFVNPYRLMDYLEKPDTPKTNLYLGFLRHNARPLRNGKYAVSMEAYNKTIYPDFCLGVGYVLSSDLVLKMVEIFDPKKPLRLEDVYTGILAARLGGIVARHHQGMRPWQYGPCKYFSDTIAYHQASINCMAELFNQAMKERLENQFKKFKSKQTEENKQLASNTSAH